MKNKKGQSLVEIIFSIGVIAMVIVGIVTLMINVINAKNSSLKRDIATDLSERVIEELVQKKKMSPDEFWRLDEINGEFVNGANVYKYKVGFTEVSDTNCDDNINDCANATIDITWDEEKNSLSVTRFFSRRG